MARIVIVGGIESTYRHAQLLHELGEEIAMFYTRGPLSPGWEGVKPVDDSRFPFFSEVPKTVVDTNINDHVGQIRDLSPDVIYSLGWQQIFREELLSVCSVVGLHESLLPRGAGPVPLANAILHDLPETGCSLFWVDAGMDTGDLIAQLKGSLDPRTVDATALYDEAMRLGGELLRMYSRHINRGSAPRIPQDMSRRTTYGKVFWNAWPEERVQRARVYPYA